MNITSFLISVIAFPDVSSQEWAISKVTMSDWGNDLYKNLLSLAGYSHPDSVRVGDDFYIVSSSFEAVRGLSIVRCTYRSCYE